MSAARLHIVHDGPYPVFARPALLPRSYGVCALSHPDHPHEAELDDNGICAPGLAYLYRDPFVIRRARRTWRQSLAHWWRGYRWIACLALAGCCWLLAVLEFGRLIAAWQGGIWT
jgi:hypothetical protein